MLAVYTTLLVIITLPILIPWIIWALILWGCMKHKYGKLKANLLIRAYVDSMERTVISEIVKYVIWPYGIVSRTYEIMTFCKRIENEG